MGTESRNREFTWVSVGFGLLLAVVFGAANAYLGLKAGMTVSASIPAAVISMCVLRYVFRRGGLLESNLVQTIGSAGESIASGAVFTLPAIFLWQAEGRCDGPGILEMTLVSLVGGVLGVLFMIPLRKTMIAIDDPKLVFPEGRACAEVLKAGEERGGARKVFAGLGFGFLYSVALDGLKIVAAPLQKTFSFGGSVGFAPSPALAGVGYIVGLKAGAMIFAGTFLSRMVLVPAYCAWGGGQADAVWAGQVKYVAVGAIAAAGVISLLHAIVPLARSLRRPAGRPAGAAEERGRRDLGRGTILCGIAAVLVLAVASPVVPVGIGGAALIVVFGFFFSVVAVRVTAIVGSSNSPISGMTIATLLAVTALMKFAGGSGMATMVGAIAIGSVICQVTAISGDTAQDLKTGHLLGATPRWQQIGELLGVAVSSMTIGIVLRLFHAAWTFGGDQLSAPQAALMKTVVEGVMEGGLSWGSVAIGAALATGVSFCRIPTMPFALGMYLPMTTTAAVVLGGLVRWASERRGRPEAGTLFSAGLVAGEGFAGLSLAVATVFGLAAGEPVWASPWGVLGAGALLFGVLSASAAGRRQP